MSVFIIAEAGVNHNGSIETAYKLIDIASKSGADAIKFQTFKAKNLLTQNAPKAQYQKNHSNDYESQFEMIKKLELDEAAHKKLIAYCKKKKIIFLSTPFDHDSINMLHSLGLEIFKIPSGEITNLPFLIHIGSLSKKVILSTGMSDIEEVKAAFNVLVESGTKKQNISILHANTMYPTPMQDVNLNVLKTIAEKFKVSYGYSDHTLGIEVGIAAVAMGASIIEKHFTLDKNALGPDHASSLMPKEFSNMVTSIRNIEIAMGGYSKIPTSSERENRSIVRKSIVASCNIKKGDIFTESNLTIKRPGTGISPMKWFEIIGQKSKKNYSIDDLI